jgi:hypothetical protein
MLGDSTVFEFFHLLLCDFEDPWFLHGPLFAIRHYIDDDGSFFGLLLLNLLFAFEADLTATMALGKDLVIAVFHTFFQDVEGVVLITVLTEPLVSTIRTDVKIVLVSPIGIVLVTCFVTHFAFNGRHCVILIWIVTGEL